MIVRVALECGCRDFVHLSVVRGKKFVDLSKSHQADLRAFALSLVKHGDKCNLKPPAKKKSLDVTVPDEDGGL